MQYKILQGVFLANGAEGKAGEVMELEMTESEEKSLIDDGSIEIMGDVKKNETEVGQQDQKPAEGEIKQPEAQDQGEVKG